MTFFGTFFSIQANIITILEAEQPGRQSEGSFNRGFSTKTYPAIYLPNIIPALSSGDQVVFIDLDSPLHTRMAVK